MADFSINDTTRRVLATGNGSTTSFSFSFQVNAVTDIKVYVDGTLRTQGSGSTNYAVQDGSGSAGLSNTGTGAVVFVTAPSNNTTVTILSDIPLSRSSLYTSGGNVTATALENDFDTITMALGDAEERDFRSIKAPVQDPVDINMTLPAKASRVGKMLGFNETTGNPEATFNTADGQTLSNIASDIATLADIEDGTDSTNAIQTVAGIHNNVTIVSGVASEVTALAGKTSEITALSNSDVIADMALLGTTDVIADMALLANADVISDMNTLAVTDVINDINTLATSDIVADLNTLATSDIVSDINTLATSDIVSDLNTLATSDIVSDINTLATSDIVTDLNLLATSDFVSDLNTMATTANVNNLSTVASNITGVNSFSQRYRVGSSEPTSDNDAGDLFFNTTTNELRAYNGSIFQATAPSSSSQNNINIVAGEITSTEDLGSITESIDTSSGNNIDTVANSITNVNTVADADSNITALNASGVITNIGIVAGVASNVTTVANNVTGLNSFSERYRVASSAPTSSLDEGDLYYDSTANSLNYYNGSAWVAVVAGAMTSLIVDTSPELGGNLDVLTHSIVSSSNRDITIAPNGSGEINLNGTVNTDNLTMDFGSIA